MRRLRVCMNGRRRFHVVSRQSLGYVWSLISIYLFSTLQMAYTVGSPLKMLGTYWAQSPRARLQEVHMHAPQLHNALKQSLEKFAATTGKFPEHLFVYRGGVSE